MSLKKVFMLAPIALSVSVAHGATFVMENYDTGYAIDGNNGSQQEGEEAYLYTLDYDNVNQHWVQYSMGDGYYLYKKYNTDLCLDGGDGGAKYQAVTLEECDEDDYNQHWEKIKIYSGTEIYRFVKRNASGYSIDGSNNDANFQGIYLWPTQDGNENQMWELTNLDDVPSSSGSGDIDLSTWKLTLPVSQEYYFDDSDSDSAAEIYPEDCTDGEYDGLTEGFEDDDYFYWDGDELVFVTPLDGGSTTPSTSYVRSELRELYGWSSGQCDGSSSANWDPDGTHVLKGTLKVTDYYDDDPQTIVGQIHAKDSDKALLKLQWDGPDADVRAIINEDPDDGNPFSLDFGLVPGTDEWSYVITMDDGELTIAVTYGGSTVTKSVEFGEDDMSDDWFDHEYYFKAGNYAQADKDSGGNFEVRFSNIEVSHD